jgi:transcriptional regulator with XRE-family HTH domain
MPRKKCNPDPQLLAAIPQIKQFIMQNCDGNQSEFARKTGVSQYQINRILSGRTKGFVPDAKKLCNYAKIDIESGITEPSRDARLMAALDKVNDRSEETVELLTAMIELVGQFVVARVNRRPASAKGTK